MSLGADERNCQFKSKPRTRAGVIFNMRAISNVGWSGSMVPAAIKAEKTRRSISDLERVPKAGLRYPSMNFEVNFTAAPGLQTSDMIERLTRLLPSRE